MRSLLLLCTAATASAALIDVHVVERTDLPQAPGAPPYEKIVARALFAVDPKLPANRIITDLRHASTNAEGRVEFTADIHVLKPADPSRGNGTALFEVSNRGGMGLLRTFDSGDSPRFLAEQGFTLVWTGWQFDVADRPGALRVTVPVARGIRGLVRTQDSITEPTGKLSVADRGHTPYAAENPADPAHRMFVRDYAAGPRTEIPRAQWRFTDATTITLDGGFRAGKTYEVIYTAKDPAIAGLGAAAVRDFISFLKYGGGKPTSLLGDQRRHLKRAIAFGSSQSGRFLRDFLYQGFNGDEQGRIVFDGVMPHIAGGARGSFTHRFAQPSRNARQYHSDTFPFLDLPETDAVTGEYDGILRVAQGSGTVPKIMYTNTSNEYWRSSASLTHTSQDGARDAALPPTSRIYLLAGCQHGAGAWPPRKDPELLFATNPNDYRPILRALLTAMNAWITDNKQPPDSRYPTNEARQLAAPGAIRFPKIPDFLLPTRIWSALRLDYGPDYRTDGIVGFDLPKTLGVPYGNRLPAVDADGNETSGIRNPVLAVPLGTYLGWNLAAKPAGPDTEIANLTGSYIPFARTRAGRDRSGDARLSIEERYRSRNEYLARLNQAAAELAKQGYLLERDIAGIRARGLQEWDDLAKLQH